jgi:hypothetical protein
VPSDISNRTGFWVLLCSTDVRSLICPDSMTSTTFSRTRSQPRNLLSMAMLNTARSRWLSANSSRTRIAQTCFGFSGRFWPTTRPLFQAGQSARMAGKFGVCTTVSPARQTLPHRPPEVETPSYQEMLRCIRGRLRAQNDRCCKICERLPVETSSQHRVQYSAKMSLCHPDSPARFCHQKYRDLHMRCRSQ